MAADRILKVDRVMSPEDAVLLEEAGANVLSIDLAHRIAFAEDRSVRVPTAKKIAAARKNAKLCAHFFTDRMPVEECIELSREIGLDGIQVWSHNAVPDPEYQAKLVQAEIGIVCSGIDAEYDMEIDWVLDAYENVPARWFQIELNTSLEDGWKSIRETSPKHPEEMQILDLEILAATHPLLLSVNFTPGNVNDVLTVIPSLRGLSMTLGAPNHPSLGHSHELESALEVLRAVR